MGNLRRKLTAEALGTALLLTVVIGSGIMAERLSDGNVAVALLANTMATVGGLYVLIEVFGPVSGAHFNPAVSAVMALRRELPKAALLPYITAQLAGAVLGAWLAHAMFDMAILQFSNHVRSGVGQWVAEAVATAGLVLVVLRAPAGRARARALGGDGGSARGSPPILLGQPAGGEQTAQLEQSGVGGEDVERSAPVGQRCVEPGRQRFEHP